MKTYRLRMGLYTLVYFILRHVFPDFGVSTDPNALTGLVEILQKPEVMVHTIHRVELEVEEVGMSSTHATANDVVYICSRSQTELQAVADLLLLSSDSRPVKSEQLVAFQDSYLKCREAIITKTKGLLVLVKKLNELLHSVAARWQDICDCMEELCTLGVGLIEYCAHTSYLLAINFAHCRPAVDGIIDPYTVQLAQTQISISCTQIQSSNSTSLDPPKIVQLCSTINKNLSVLTESCVFASERASQNNQEQFKLCVKSFTSSASCLVSSIRGFKDSMTRQHHRWCVGFCDPLIASTKAMINFAVDEEFTGKPAQLTAVSLEAKKGVLGACLVVVSACIQICRTVREVAYNPKSDRRDFIQQCIASVSRGSTQLSACLMSHTGNEPSGPVAFLR